MSLDFIINPSFCYQTQEKQAAMLSETHTETHEREHSHLTPRIVPLDSHEL